MKSARRRGQLRHIGVVRCLSIALILLGAAAGLRAADPAETLVRAARQAEASGDNLNAFFLYGRAAKVNPANSTLGIQSAILGSRLLQSSATSAGLDLIADPAEREAARIAVERISPTDAIEGAAALPPIRLKPSAERKSFDLRGTTALLLEQVGAAFGIDVNPEQDLQQGGPTITFRLTDATRDETFRALESATNTFLVPVRENEVLAFRDSADKRTTNVPVMAVAIPIPQRFNVQEAQELATGVQQIMELRRIAVDAGRRVIFMRDQEYKIIAARRLVADLMRSRAQVMVEVELLSTASNSSLSYGLSLQNAASIVNFNTASALSNVARLGTSWFGVGIANAQSFATFSRSSSESSLRTQLVTLDGQQAQLHVGDRYPVITGLSGFGANSVPTTQFQDLGLKLQITPVVHGSAEMTLTIEADYNLLTGGSNNGIPIISNRKLQATARVKDGEWAVIAGLAKVSSGTTSSGIAGLGQIPGFGHIFRHDTVDKDESQILIILKPRLLSEPASERPSPGFWIGTETKPPTYY